MTKVYLPSVYFNPINGHDLRNIYSLVRGEPKEPVLPLMHWSCRFTWKIRRPITIKRKRAKLHEIQKNRGNT